MKLYDRLGAMPLKINVLPVLFLLVLFGDSAVAQSGVSDTGYVKIDSIFLLGNRQTRNSVILRELEFAPGDSIRMTDLQATLDRNSLRLLNLKLFTLASIHVDQWKPGGHVNLLIKMTETWFILPVPLFTLADRNFNVWWNEYNASLRRVNYGLDLSHNNLSGAADVLKVKLEFGYNNRYEIAYRFPPLNHDQTIRLMGGISYSRQHEVAYTTLANKLVFRRDPDLWLIKQFTAFSNLNWRPGLHTTHSFSAEYRDTEAADSIAQILNPEFFGGGSTHQKHASLLYNLHVDYRDMNPYPLKGWQAIVELRQNGLLPTDNLHLFRAFGEFDYYTPLVKRLYADIALKGRVSLPRRRPPYFNNQALGYFGNFVRGYEYYVADGLDFGVIKTSIHYEVLNRSFSLGKCMPFKAFKEMPLKLYVSFNNDAGYANDPYFSEGNPQTKRVLYGYGFGLDIVAWYNKIARLEYSWNDLGQGGLYIQIDSGF